MTGDGGRNGGVRVPTGLLVRGVRLLSGAVGDLYARDGVLTAGAGRPVGTGERPTDAGGSPGAGVVVDLGPGWTALPRLAEAHVHLDKTLLGPRWYPHLPGERLSDRIELEARQLAGGGSLPVEPVEVRAARLLGRLVRRGATLVRSDVDVTPRLGLRRVEALLALRERWRQVVDVQLVAFPQEGLVSVPGVPGLLREAVEAGVEVVGGLDPQGYDGDRAAHLDTVFGLAEATGARIDLHLHERGELGESTLLEVAVRTRTLGLSGRVAVSHAFALADLPAERLGRVIATLADAGVAVVTGLPGEGLLPPLAWLRALGVTVAAASDHVRDAWSPFGQADPLEHAALAAYLVGWRTDADLTAALDLVTGAPAAVLGAPAALLRPGDPADFTLVPASGVPEAVVERPLDRLVVRAGRVVVHGGTLAEPVGP